MSGVIPPLPQYAFMAWCLVKSTGTTLPFTFYLTVFWIFKVSGYDRTIVRKDNVFKEKNCFWQPCRHVELSGRQRTKAAETMGRL
jgi:hypothetical protein